MENLSNYQEFLEFVIISFILMTLMFDSGVTKSGETRWLPLLRTKRLKQAICTPDREVTLSHCCAAHNAYLIPQEYKLAPAYCLKYWKIVRGMGGGGNDKPSLTSSPSRGSWCSKIPSRLILLDPVYVLMVRS